MFRQLDGLNLLQAVAKMKPIIRNKDHKGSYAIHKIANNQIEVYVESLTSQFKYRVHFFIGDNYVKISSAGNYIKGILHLIYPMPSKVVLNNTFEYAYKVFLRETSPSITKKSKLRKSPRRHNVSAHKVTGHRLSNGTYSKGYFKGEHLRGLG